MPIDAVRIRSRAPWDLETVRIPAPEPGPGEVLIRTESVGLCGSDVHAVRADSGYEWVPAGVIIGHEVCGKVVGVGDGADPRLLGQRVSPIAIDGCGECLACQGEETHSCEQRDCLGLHFDGGLAGLFVIAADRLHVLANQQLAPELGALIEPAAVAHHAVSLLPGDLAGKRVAVSGPGAIGLLAGVILQSYGATVTMVGPPTGAVSRLAAARALGLGTDDGGGDFAHWLDASGAPAAIRAALPRVARGGTLVVPAMFANEVTIDMNHVVRERLTIRGSYAYTRRDYSAAERILDDRSDDVHSLVELYSLDDTILALQRAAAAETIKPVVLFPPANNDHRQRLADEIGSDRAERQTT